MCVGVCAKTCHTSAAIGGVGSSGGRLYLGCGVGSSGGRLVGVGCGAISGGGRIRGGRNGCRGTHGGHCMRVVAARVPRVVSSGRRVEWPGGWGPYLGLGRGGAGLGRYYLVGQPVWFYLVFLGGGSPWVVGRASYVVLPARS